MRLQYMGSFLPALHLLVHDLPAAITYLVDFGVITPARRYNSRTRILVNYSLAIIFEIHDNLEFFIESRKIFVKVFGRNLPPIQYDLIFCSNKGRIESNPE